MAIPVPTAHVGDMPVLTRLITDGKVLIDVSVANVSVLEMRFKAPTGGTDSTVTCGYTTDGTDGLVTVPLLGGVTPTWDVAGRWLEQIHMTLVAGSKNFALTAEQRTVFDRIF